MKICILSIVNIKHMSLISLYTSYFDVQGIEYDIIYIDKYNEIEKSTATNLYKYPININRNWNFFKKLIVYSGFRKYAKDIIKLKQYDFVIVWRTETSLMFIEYLLNKKMKNKYCLNIRDYCMEKNPLIYCLQKKLISNSSFTTISSDGFRSFLPKMEYITVHSFNEQILKNVRNEKNNNGPINICFIGYIRFLKHCTKLMDELKNDNRFILQFYGEGSNLLKGYADKNNIKNVDFYGGFKVEETAALLGTADIINCLFGYGTLQVDTLLSIRLYYAIYLRLPVLVYNNTYMQKVAEECGIGFVIKNDDFSNLGDKISVWLSTFNYKNADTKCAKYINKIKSENLRFKDLLIKQFGAGIDG